jgi:hypothetical protein
MGKENKFRCLFKRKKKPVTRRDGNDGRFSTFIADDRGLDTTVTLCRLVGFGLLCASRAVLIIIFMLKKKRQVVKRERYEDEQLSNINGKVLEIRAKRRGTFFHHRGRQQFTCKSMKKKHVIIAIIIVLPLNL